MGFRAIERIKDVIMLCLRKSCLNFVTTLPVSTYQENYLWEIFKLVTRITKTIVRSLMSPCYNWAISTARLISMSQGIRPKLLAICDFMIVARGSVGQCLNISRLGFALQPQADCVAADIEHEQFTREAFL